MGRVLVVNSGSSSVKYQVIDTDSGAALVVGSIERIGAGGAMLTQTRASDGTRIRQSASILDHRDAIRAVLELITDPERGAVERPEEIDAVGHRVVHGGERFTGSEVVDNAVLEGIRESIALAPLHNPHNLSGIQAARERLPDVPHVAVFDTAFHATLEPHVFHYAVPYVLYKRHRIRRYGFHGTSHAYVSSRVTEMCDLEREGDAQFGPREGGEPGLVPSTGAAAEGVAAGAAAAGGTGVPREGGRPCRVVSIHLGNGASATAVLDGRSVDTSMGFTPLEGLVMGTRSGDLDPAVILHVMGREELTVSDATSLLNKHSGLQGLSGISPDMRDLLEEEAAGSERARLALDVYCYRVRKYIGAYAAALGGLDAIGFTGGIGQNSPAIRARCLEGLGFLGVEVDGDANEALTGGAEGTFHRGPVLLAALRTGEELVIAREAARLAGK